MKRLSNIFPQLNERKMVLKDEELSTGYEMSAYVQAASGKTGDTQEDRLLAIFQYFRKNDIRADWYRVPGLRDFFTEYILSCPFIPKDLRDAEVLSRAIPPNPKQFLNEWTEKFGLIESFEIKIKELFETIDILDDVKTDFLSKNLHSVSYFFSKYTEWHITRVYQERMQAKKVVDIGAAYDGFARILSAFDPHVHVTMVDLDFPVGLKKHSKCISKLGADAAKMDAIPTNSVDLVCMHNAFEHFANNSDVGCLTEVSRILRPNGVALITPFFFAQQHSITLSPASSFLFDRTSYYSDLTRKELETTGGRLDFNTRIVSPFARRYDLETTISRIVETVPDLDVELKRCDFSAEDKKSVTALPGYPEMKIDPRLYDKVHFNFLEFTKK